MVALLLVRAATLYKTRNGRQKYFRGQAYSREKIDNKKLF